jgi:hypothetical protein
MSPGVQAQDIVVGTGDEALLGKVGSYLLVVGGIVAALMGTS